MKQRDQSIDVLRGLALFIMLFANAAPYLINEQHPFYVRVMDSLAAPMFISIAGYSILLSNPYNTTFLKNFKRGFAVIIMAVFIDVFIWKISPFIGYDVLYIIGFSVLISPFFIKLKSYFLVIIALCIAISAFVLQYFFYKNQIDDLPLNIISFEVILNHLPSFLVYGWFPLFPWLSIFIFGYLFHKNESIIQQNWKAFYSIILIIIIALLLFVIYRQNKIVRGGYSELFYPMDIVFFTFSICFLSLFFINKSFFSNNYFKFLSFLGQHSMFVYLIHCLYISTALHWTIFKMNNTLFLRIIVFYLIIYLLVLCIIQLKKWEKWPKNSFFLRFLFGS
ncbi:MAG: DUF1624 domain-containing protein [Flavobacteriia bacterium]|nr:DUF1624 domain-containing protein [Flavobacteriia bacterium]